MKRRDGVGVLAVLGRPPYRRLWAAHTISRAGDTFWTVALAVHVFQLTGSGLGVAGVVVAEILPVLLVGPVAGVAVDRFDRRSVLVAADLWRAALALGLVAAGGSVAAVYAIAFALSAGSVFFNPAAAALLPELVPDDELVPANTGLWTAAVASQIVLAPLAGLAIAVAGPNPAFALDAASFAASALVLRGLPRVVAAGVSSEQRWVARISEGARLVGRDPLLRLLAAVQALAALSAGATSALLVVLANHRLGVRPRGYGVLLGAIGVGAVCGPLLLARVAPARPGPGFVFGPYLLRGGVDMALATVTSPALAVAALAAYGVGTSTGMVTFNSLLQLHAPAEARGRVLASFDVLWQLGRLASIAGGGVLADTLGVRAVYWIGGGLLVAAGVLGLARRGRVAAAQ